MYQKSTPFAKKTLFNRAPLLLKYHFLFFSPSKSSDFKWQGFFNYFAVKCGGDAWRLLAFGYYKRHHFRQSLCRIEVVLNDANSAIKSKKMWAFLCPEILFFQFEIRHNGKLLFQKIEIGKTQLAWIDKKCSRKYVVQKKPQPFKVALGAKKMAINSVWSEKISIEKQN